MATLVNVNTNADFSLIEISETGTKQGCHVTNEGTTFEQLEWAENMIIPFTDKVTTNIKMAWREDNTKPWNLYASQDQPKRYGGCQLVTDRDTKCTDAGVFCTLEEAMLELLDEEGSSFNPKQYSDSEYNVGFTNYYDFWMLNVGNSIKAAIGVAMLAKHNQ